MDNMITKFFKNISPAKVYTYEEYLEYSKQNLANSINKDISGTEELYFNYRKLNNQRISRINKTFKASEEVIRQLKKIDEEQSWLLVTEDWCGDSAQNIPYFVNYLEFNPFIKLYVFIRDDNLEAIDKYFNEGNPRSIPKIIAFDKNGSELFIWGSRPRIAQDLVQQLKAEGYPKEEFNKELHLWYARNKGKELEKEFIEVLKKIHQN